MSRSSGRGPDYDAAMAGARLQWDALSPTMQDEMARAVLPTSTPARRLRYDVPASTGNALQSRKLAQYDDWLTPMGLLVREAGLAALMTAPMSCAKALARCVVLAIVAPPLMLALGLATIRGDLFGDGGS